jgi:type VI secretion system protein ImpM
MPIDSAGQLSSTLEQLLSLALAAAYRPLAVWWTEGSAHVEPCCLISSGLPSPDSFTNMLDGSWAQPRWRTVTAEVQAGESSQEIPGPVPPLRFESAAATHVGRVRNINQDSFVERTHVGLWAVADGLGGHRDGEIASREVCDALAQVEASSSFETMIENACERVQSVNDHLLRSAARSLRGDRCGSTVVALLVRDRSCAVIWAGDSRVYRWRSGRLEALTDDHSAGGSDAMGRQESHYVTRAVGVESKLLIDVRRDDVRDGDRFLLCSDGLTRIIPEPQIERWLGGPDIRATVDGLIQATLDAGAPDNVTVLIAQANA